MELFYIGERFYLQSGTAMSSIYEVGTLKRSDWGFVQMALRNGDSVNIRPATESEMTWANRSLAAYLKQDN